eukprot:CCRYP_018115-RB/>CCRYP_018115-RB protein AED:0.22 eAED:0.14 QI:0/-1/0/1/-1/0/1/0/82
MILKASKSMDMHFQWLKCRHTQSLFKYLWTKVTKNRADYPSKHHPAKHHLLVHLHNMCKTQTLSEEGTFSFFCQGDTYTNKV